MWSCKAISLTATRLLIEAERSEIKVHRFHGVKSKVVEALRRCSSSRLVLDQSKSLDSYKSDFDCNQLASSEEELYKDQCCRAHWINT
jgi:hypothetical protein